MRFLKGVGLEFLLTLSILGASEGCARTGMENGYMKYNQREHESGILALPRIISAPEPVFPPECKEQGIAGSFYASLYIDKKGNVRKIEVTGDPNNLCYKEFSAAIERATRSWQFEPATYKGEPVDYKHCSSFHFHF